MRGGLKRVKLNQMKGVGEERKVADEVENVIQIKSSTFRVLSERKFFSIMKLNISFNNPSQHVPNSLQAQTNPIPSRSHLQAQTKAQNLIVGV